MPESLLLIQAAATWAMVGLIWFVQVVHYPLFGQVPPDGFAAYERSHQTRTTLVVAPLMLVEACTALLLPWLRPPGVPMVAAVFGLVLLAVLWFSTYLWQVPAHARLAQSFDAATQRRLVRSNWLRTVVWTLRGGLVAWMLSVACFGTALA